MECKVYIGKELIGNVIFEIVDESMGGISGKLQVNPNYEKFQNIIQKHTDENGISNPENFNYRIMTKNDIELKPEGGIGISDYKEFNDIIIESAGIDLKIFDN